MLTAAAALCVLFYLNWKLTLTSLVVLLAFAVVMALAFLRLRPLFRKRNEIYAEVAGRLTEAMGGIRIVKAYTAEKREQRVFARGAHKLFRNVAKTMTAIAGISAMSSLVIGAVGVAMMLIGGRSVLAGEMTLGDFVMYVFFTGLLAAPMIQIAAIGTQLTEAFAGLDRIREVMGETDRRRGRSRAGRRSPRCAATSSSRACPSSTVPGSPVLREVSFLAPAGTTTALVGSSARARARIIGLVMAFYRPTSGRVLVDGRDLATVRLRDYRSHLGVVLQDNFLFDGTIAENVAYARPGASRAEIEGGRDGRALRRVRGRFREGLRHGGGGARREALGRTAPARGDRPRHPRRPRAS